MPGISGSQKAPLFSQFGVLRFGATRFGYSSAYLFLSVGGVQVAVGAVGPGRVLIDSLSITDVLNEQPNTCQWTALGAKPTVGQEVIIQLGASSGGRRLFAGHLLDVQQTYVGQRPANIQYQVSAVDYTWQLGFKKVTAFYSQQSATAIAQSLITSYAAANGFTAVNVQAGLPTVLGGITFTDEDLPNALSRLAARIGGYWYVDYTKDLHFFLTDVGPTPTDLTVSHPSLANFVSDVDLSQTITRVYVEGRGTTILAAIGIGETLIPVASVDMFQVIAGVFVKASFQGSEGGAQHLTYTGVAPGGLGSIVGPGLAASSAPTGLAQSGAGVTSGTHQYAYVWVTAAGPTLPSPLSAVVTTGTVAPPTAAPIASQGVLTGGLDHGANYSYKYTWSSAATSTDHSAETTPSPASTAAQTSTGSLAVIFFASPDPAVQWIHVYRTVGGGATYLLAFSWPNTSAGYTDSQADGSLGAAVPGANTAIVNQVAVAGIAVGPTGTTSRALYRTAAGGSQLKLVTTIANNTATTYLDSTADGSLGANAPVADTSGLTQPAGTINPGSTTLRVAGTGFARASGGWALVGDQVVRYTGFSAGQLTGIPASGAGAITAAIAHDTSITAAPMLTGIPASGTRSIQIPLSAGDELYLVVQRDNLDAQATLAARLGAIVPVPPPTAAPTWTGAPLGVGLIGQGYYGYAYTYVTATGESVPGPRWLVALLAAPNTSLVLDLIAVGPPGTIARRIYRTVAHASLADSTTGPLRRIGELADNTTTTAPDATADGALGVLAPDAVDGGGIREEWIQDRRLSIAEATARGDAFLASRPLDAASISYTCRDLDTASGKDITVNLVAPTSVTGVFKIQTVTISNFRPYPNQLPTFAVQASAQRYSFEDLLRRAR